MLKVRVLGGGWYGCVVARTLLAKGFEVELHELKDRLFAGASGANPARLHLGFHYPRSRLTRAHCQEHQAQFMAEFGHLTRAVPVNIYAIAAVDSQVDFANYVQSLRSEVEFLTIHDPAEFGLQNVEGAVLTGERHIIIRKAREFFEKELAGHVRLNSVDAYPMDFPLGPWDWTIDCTFCARDSANVDRYEPCLTAILNGPIGKAITIMDGPFPSIYPWDEDNGWISLTSAKFTPFARCETWPEAKLILDNIDYTTARLRAKEMFDQMAYFYPDLRHWYYIQDHKLGIRAMPKSGSDARLVDIVKISDRVLRVRAGKIDAVLHAAEDIARMISA